MEEYRSKYDVDSLSNPNDLANLHTMIRNQLLIEQLQDSLDELAKGDEIDPGAIKKILDSIVALSQTNVAYERQLGIDRKTRQTEESQSVVDYIVHIKNMAREFIQDEKRLTKIICKKCKIQVGRISGVYDSTYYYAEFQCPQCRNKLTVTRKERDVFFDLKVEDREWRRKFPIEVEQAKRSKAAEIEADNDVMIGNEFEDGLEMDDTIKEE